MEFKSIEFTGDHSIKTTYMAGDGNCWTEDFKNMFAAMKWLHEF